MLVIFLAGVEIDELLRKDASAGEEGIIGVLRYRRWRVGPVDALFVRAAKWQRDRPKTAENPLRSVGSETAD